MSWPLPEGAASQGRRTLLAGCVIITTLWVQPFAVSIANDAGKCAGPAGSKDTQSRDPDLLPEEVSLLFGEEPTTPAGPAPRTPDGHPDLSGFWKGSRATKPVGNIGK